MALTHEAFADDLDRHYVAITTVGDVVLELVDVVVHAEPRPFTLTFSGPIEPELAQGTYEFRHTRFAEPEPIFIVPISRPQDGMRYEAVFA